MKSEEIKQLVKEFENALTDIEGIECWSARDLQLLLGYNKWENFEKVIRKAKDACNNAGGDETDHFPDVRKMVDIGSGTEREIADIALTRYACYLIAQNGDSRKSEIAFAQTYFAELIKAPRSSIEYVIIHELCHLVYHNHTRLFFDLLNKILPGWKKYKERLEYSMV